MNYLRQIAAGIVTFATASVLSGCSDSPQNQRTPDQKMARIIPAGGAPQPTSGPAFDPLALIGKAPPPIVVAKWIKGAPLTSFESGKVYVVDFWATWCGPCRAAIPHLSKLQEKSGGAVEVIGVAISERQKDAHDTSYVDGVEKFVEKQGERMNYRVAVDTPTKTMHATWFKPTGTGGIPTAYIIDKKGLVAWTGVGTPSVIERIVEEVLAGTFDITKEMARQKAEEESARKRSEADIAAAKVRSDSGTDRYSRYPGYKEAMARGDQSAALESLNSAFKADPESEVSGAYQWKFMLLMQRAGGGAKPDEVNQYVRELLAKYPTNDDIMGFASACIVSTAEEQMFDKDLAFQTAKIAADLAKPDSRWAQFSKMRLGWAYHHIGDKEKAIQSMRAAIEGVTRLKDKHDFGDLALQCEEALRYFQESAK